MKTPQRTFLLVVISLALLSSGALAQTSSPQITGTPVSSAIRSADALAPDASTSLDLDDEAFRELSSTANRPSLTSASRELHVHLTAQSGGSVYAVAVQGSFAYVGVGPNLLVMNVSDPAHPSVVGQLRVLDGVVRSLTVVGNAIYAGVGYAGLRVISIAAPAKPQVVGGIDTPGFSWNVRVVGNYAYIADGDQGLRIISIADPTKLREVAAYLTPGYVWDVAVAGTLAYLADGDTGLRIINIANPANPTQVGIFSTPGYSQSVVVVDHYAYIADYASGLEIIDVVDPAHPSQIAVFDTPGRAHGVTVDGSYAYVADEGSGLRIISIANPAIPQEIGVSPTPLYPWGTVVVGNYAYVADRYLGLAIVDITNRASPSVVSSFATSGLALGIAAAGNYVYLAHHYSGLSIFDITNRDQPREVGIIDTHGDAEGVTVVDNFAYVANGGGGLQIINVANPSTPQVVGILDTPGDARGVAVVGNYAYLADGGSGLQIINVADPSQPSLVSSFNTEGDARSVAVVGNYAYLADGKGGLRIIRITDPTAPQQIAVQPLPEARDVKIKGSFAYVADFNLGMRVVNIADPAHPSVVGTIDSNGDGRGVAVAGDYAFVGDKGGVRIFSVTNPTDPREVGSYDPPGVTWGMVIINDRVFVADGSGGLAVLQFTKQPRSGIVFLPGVIRIIPAVPCDPFEPNDTRFAASARPLLSSQPYQAKLCSKDIEDNYSIDSPTNSPLRIDLTVPASLVRHVTVRLYAQSNLNTSLCGGLVASTTFNISCDIPGAGRYIVNLRGDGSSAEQDPYTLQVTSLWCDIFEPNDARSTSAAGPLVSGQVYGARLCTADYEDNFAFQTTTNIPVRVDLTLPPTLVGRTLIWLYRQSDGYMQPICGIGGVNTAASTLTCPISGAGHYVVRLYTDNAADNINPYTLKVTYS
jgi:hypothetical protein